jgi:hypothetical protein
VFILIPLLGFLGKLSLQIPWRDLSSKPVVVRIERVYLLVQPKPKSSVRTDHAYLHPA